MRVRELIKLYSPNIGDVIAIYYNGEKVYEDWAVNYDVRMPDIASREVKNFWHSGKRMKIQIW